MTRYIQKPIIRGWSQAWVCRTHVSSRSLRLFSNELSSKSCESLCSRNEANSRQLRHLRGLINAAGVNYVPEKRPNCRQSLDAARRGSFQAISRESLRWSTVDSKRDRSTCLRAKQTNRSDPETGYTRDFGETVGAGCLGRGGGRGDVRFIATDERSFLKRGEMERGEG